MDVSAVWRTAVPDNWGAASGCVTSAPGVMVQKVLSQQGLTGA
ncbi:hypothetical protein [Silvimonas amylolytica]|nr:hypothetical protein [Silvimonas amylolytica]